MAVKKYRALVDLWYPDPASPGEEKHVRAGDVAEGIPQSSIAPEFEAGHIEEVGA
jgi:hypothetical protein